MLKVTKPCFEVSKDKNNDYRFLLKSSNGRSLIWSIVGYKTEKEILQAINNLIIFGSEEDNYDYETANIKGGGLYFWIDQVDYDTGLTKKLAISQTYIGCNNQIIEMGKEKGIRATVKSLQKIKEKSLQGKRVVLGL